MKFNKICMCLRAFLNGLSFFLGVLFLGLMSCSSATVSSPSSPTEDKTPPTLAISTNQNLEIGKIGTITFAFSERVTNFILGDIQLLMNGGGVTPDRVKFVTNSQKNYSLEIKPTIAGTLTVTVQTNSFEDLSSNQNTNNFSTNFSVEDKTPPTVNISSEALIEGESAYLSFIFSENVNNFTPDDIQFLTNKTNGVSAYKSNFVTNSQENYSLQITPIKNGTLYVSIPANSFEDLSGNQNDKPYSNSFTVLDSSTITHIISFKLNGGSFISPQITNLKVVSGKAIEQTKLGGILSYPPTGPKPDIEAVTRGIFEWQTTNGTKYDFSTLVSSDLTLEAVWSNSCGKIETFHPADRNALQNYVNAALGANSTTNLNHIDTSAITDMNNLFDFKRSFNGEIGCWNTAKVNNMNNMFKNANSFNQDISGWNVANVTDMSYMFFGATAFNQDISKWNVANVTDMGNMFQNANAFNQDISRWDVANVTAMNYMFGYAGAFNQDISKWDVGNVNNMGSMFYYASSFNQDISKWDVGNVNNMSSMFGYAGAFNQDIGSWNVANVNNMNSMFFGAYAFNQDISKWDVGNVTDMNDMFQNANAFNQDISRWNVANVTHMNRMFFYASNFNQNIGSWNVANVIYMDEMFFYASAFNQDLSGWDVDKVTKYSDIFTGSAMEEKNKPAKFRTSFTISFNLNGGMFSSPQTNLIVSRGSSISQATLDKIQANYPDVGPKEGVTGVSREFVEWRVGGAKYNSGPITSDMTLGAVWSNSCGKIETVHPANRNDLKTYTDAAIGANATTNLNHIDTSAITDMRAMFNGKTSFDGDIACWNISKVSNMNNMFSAANAFNKDISKWNVANVNNMSYMFQNASKFNQPIGTWDTSNVTGMNGMFADAAFNQDISNWNTANVINMGGMFQNAIKFNQPIGNWDTSKVTRMDDMFNSAAAFNQNISNWDTANVTNMGGMFQNAIFNQPIGNWDTSKVTRMDNMFNAAAAFNQNISNWNTSKVTRMDNMFNGATAFNQNISNWNTTNVNNMRGMFQNASKFNQPIGNWDTSKVILMDGMFSGATAFNQNIGSWDTANVINMRYMFNNATAFNQDLSTWSVSNVIYNTDMFKGSAMESETSQQPTFSSP